LTEEISGGSGGFWVSGGVVHVGPKVSAGIELATRLLLQWSYIAIGQERAAWDARRALEGAKAANEPVELDRELRPSLIAVAAAAHALDALYGEIRDLVLPDEVSRKWSDDPRSGPSRPIKLQETLKHGCKIAADRWRVDLVRLFDLRDAAVHPQVQFRPPTPNPVVGARTAVEYMDYRAEAATWAVDLLFEVLETCVESAKPPLLAWAKGLRGSVERLSATRADG
jgi:hypothetical protein